MSLGTENPPPLPDRFRELCQRLAESDALRAGLEAVAWACDGLFPFYRVALVLPARQPDRLHVAAAWARRAEEELEGYGFELTGHPLEAVLSTGIPHIRRDPMGDHPGSPLAALYQGEGKAEELLVPLPLGGQNGALVFASRTKGGFDAERSPWLEDLARVVAVWVRPWAGHEAPYLLEQQYQALLDGALDGIAVVVDDAITYANASFREIFGVQPGVMGLGRFVDWLHDDSLEVFGDAMAWVERKARVLPRLEIEGRRCDGHPVSLELGMQSVVYLGDPAVLVQVHNVTERAERERETREVAARTDALLRTLAHDIRGPLTTVIGFSQLLMDRDQELPEEHRQEGLRVMHRSSHAVRNLVESLLEYSALGADTSPAEMVEIHLVLQQVEAELSGDLRSTEAVVEYRRIPPRVWGRPVEVARVFRNLMHNALQHRRPEVTPKVLVSGVGEEGGHYVFCVQDNGVGVEAKRVGEIFHLFARGRGGGAGVGLSIVDRIVRGGGGRAWVESEPGQGSRFFFTLPKPGTEDG